jgi:hypothetical protein
MVAGGFEHRRRGRGPGDLGVVGRNRYVRRDWIVRTPAVPYYEIAANYCDMISASHVTSAAQEHALPPPTRSFTLAFPALLVENITKIGGGGGPMSAGLTGHDGDGEWDLIEASEEEDGVG